jgi:hypothetical protein
MSSIFDELSDETAVEIEREMTPAALTDQSLQDKAEMSAQDPPAKKKHGRPCKQPASGVLGC